MTHLPFTIFTLVSMLGLLFGMWGPYRWPTLGVRVRRDIGPWLVNFNQRQVRLCYLRDSLYTITIMGVMWGVLVLDVTGVSGGMVVTLSSLLSIATIPIQIRLEGDPDLRREAIEVVTRDTIPHQEFCAFLVRSGVMVAGERQAYIGRGAYPGGFFWIYDGMPRVYGDEAEITQLHPDDRAAARLISQDITTILQGQGQTLCFIILPRAGLPTEGEDAVLRFVCALHQRWPCAVTFMDTVMSGDAICVAAANEQRILP
jgi:hypothetical protein